MTARLIVVPGLHGSGPLHWQSWLQRSWPGALRVTQRDWDVPDVDAWAARIHETLALAAPGEPCIAAAHSFGCLALVRHLQRRPESPLRAALLVAPADPARFGIDDLPRQPLPIATTLVGSRNDPWMHVDDAEAWALRWGSHWIDLGEAGHVNVESGFGPWPFARRWAQGTGQRFARAERPRRASPAEWSFAV